ncbi:MAG: YqaJ viral recombinase family protein [Dietzia sp.]|nr:YqaJ viral recombinase family protein [Dietzia sp.]
MTIPTPHPPPDAVLVPGSPDWLATVTASKVAAIIGVSRWESPYSLWHRMAGHLPPEAPKDEFTVGHAFEPALAELWKSDNPGWRLSSGEVQCRTDRLGFPAAATLDRRASRGGARRVVEFKTARSLEDWGDEFTDNAPDDYVCQVIWQMGLTGWTKLPAHLMVMGPFFQWHTYEIPFDTAVFDALVDQSRAFWQTLQDGIEPDLDDTVPTYECVRQLHPEIEDRQVVIPTKLGRDYLAAVDARKAAEATERGLKTQLLDRMGTASSAVTDGGLPVAKRTPGRGDSVVLRSTTRKTTLTTLKELTAA